MCLCVCVLVYFFFIVTSFFKCGMHVPITTTAFLLWTATERDAGVLLFILLPFNTGGTGLKATALINKC